MSEISDIFEILDSPEFGAVWRFSNLKFIDSLEIPEILDSPEIQNSLAILDSLEILDPFKIVDFPDFLAGTV